MRVKDTVLNAATVVLLAAAAYNVTPSVRTSLRAWAWERGSADRMARTWPLLIRAGNPSAGAHRLDSGLAEVQLIEFSDFQCPFCKRNQKELKAFIAKHHQIGIVYRHLPLSGHPAAEGAAKAALCAESQASFLPMHDLLFETTEWMTDTNWTETARRAGISDLAGFQTCLASQETITRLSMDVALARSLRITGTPTFVTRERVIPGMQTDSALARLLGVAP